MSKQKVLVVDDQDDFRESLAENLVLTDRYLALQASGPATALALVEAQPDIACIVLDYDLRKGGGRVLSGVEMIVQLDAIAPHIPVIMMSGITEGRGRAAAESIRSHAVAFLDKPFAMSALLELLERTIGRAEDDAAVADVHRRLAEAGFITASPVMAKVCRDAIRAAEKGDGHVLLVGETGTGKDVLARAIHRMSPRSTKPLLVENCSTIGRDMFNSALFGHVRGAFTGANDREGLFQAAGQGMVFLDELTEMPIDVQSGLLTAIESREYRRLGETKVLKLEARIIAATSRPIAEAIRDGYLREDLRYRFERTIFIPPLRERREDIPLIVLDALRRRSGDGDSWTIDETALATLGRQPWVGNVRQLLHVVNRAAADAEANHITHEIIAEKLREEYGIDAGAGRAAVLELEGDLESTMERIRRRFVIRALITSSGNVTAAAKELGYATREGLKYWLDKYGIDAGQFAPPTQPEEYYVRKYLNHDGRG